MSKVIFFAACTSLCIPTLAAASSTSPLTIKMAKIRSGGGGFYGNDTKTVIKLTGPKAERLAAIERLRKARVSPVYPEKNGFRVYRLFGVTRIRFRTGAVAIRHSSLPPVLEAIYPDETPEQRLLHLPRVQREYETGHSSYIRYGR